MIESRTGRLTAPGGGVCGGLSSALLKQRQRPASACLSRALIALVQQAATLLAVTVPFLLTVTLPPCAQAGRGAQRVTVSLQSVCGNSNNGLVQVNATGEGSAIEVNSGMGLVNSFNCVVQFISTSNSSRMSYSIHKLDIPHTCQSRLQVWGGNQNISQAKKYCQEIEDPSGSRAQVFNENSLYVKMKTHRDDWKYGEQRVGFVMTITALRPSIQKRCFRDEFVCRGGQSCVNSKLACDGFNNCGDASDEKCLSSVIALAFIVIGAVLITVLIGVFIYYIRRKRRLRPYDTSRATSMQSVQSDTSLFGTVRETYYRPLYPIGQGLKINLDELPKDPDEPLLPPHYIIKRRPSHEHLATRLLLAASSPSKEDPGDRPNGDVDRKPTAGRSDSNPHTSAEDLQASVEESGARPRATATRRGSFPPTRLKRRDEAPANAEELVDLKELGIQKMEEDDDHRDCRGGDEQKPRYSRKHLVLLPQ